MGVWRRKTSFTSSVYGFINTLTIDFMPEPVLLIVW